MMRPDEPTDEEFRAIGFTGAARAFPRSDRGFRWVCKFNGIEPDKAPRALRFAPNEWCQRYCDEMGRLLEEEQQ